ncbi:MAG: 50S ribosomal protein L21 [Pseudomonadota bacterium]
MYAIIETGGKQYKVIQGESFEVEKLASEPDKNIELDKVLMIGGCENILIGKPFLKGCKVIASLVDEYKDKKVLVFKKKRRKGYKKTRGHRQLITKLKVEEIIVEAN